jgi:hypothetical protein
VLCPALRTLDLPLHIVHQPLHTGVQAVGVLAWQQLGGAVPVQADAAGQQLVELLHGEGRGPAGPPTPLTDTVLLGPETPLNSPVINANKLAAWLGKVF